MLWYVTYTNVFNIHILKLSVYCDSMRGSVKRSSSSQCYYCHLQEYATKASRRGNALLDVLIEKQLENLNRHHRWPC